MVLELAGPIDNTIAGLVITGCLSLQAPMITRGRECPLQFLTITSIEYQSLSKSVFGPFFGLTDLFNHLVRMMLIKNVRRKNFVRFEMFQY